VSEVHDVGRVPAFEIHPGDVTVSIHGGSRGLGHQSGTEFVQRMAVAGADFGNALPDRGSPVRLIGHYCPRVAWAQHVGLANRVAGLEPLIVIKG
jgi:tRNA-splicing ligase RtcB